MNRKLNVINKSRGKGEEDRIEHHSFRLKTLATTMVMYLGMQFGQGSELYL